MKRVAVACAALVAVATSTFHGQTNPLADSSIPDRRVTAATIGYGAALKVNGSGQVLVVADAAAPGGTTDRTFVWSAAGGLQEIRFAGTTAATRGSDLSDSGVVVGQALSPRGAYEPFVWSAGSGARLVSVDPVLDQATVAAVNDAGEVVGVAAGGAYRIGPTASFGGAPLGSASRGCASTAAAISAWGESVGASPVAAGACAPSDRAVISHAYVLRRDGTVTDLGSLGGAHSQATAVNDRGQVVGWSENAGGARHAFLWSARAGMSDLGTIDGGSSEALAVNNLGQVVGVITSTSGPARSFFWSAQSGMVDIGAGTPSAINDLGQVVGTSADATGSTAYFWSAARGRLVLAANARALDINNRGQVAGGRQTLTPPEHATLWQVPATAAETFNWYEARTQVLLYGHLITPQLAAIYDTWIADARALLARGDEAGAHQQPLQQLAAAVGDPAVSMTASPQESSRTLALSAVSAGAAPNAGGAYNLRIATDASPDLTDLNGFIDSTTSRWTSAREKVWALFYWSHILKRQTAPALIHGFEETDPIRNLTDYGFTMCSTISGINQTLWEMLGLRHQFWDICNHTVSQVEYENAFHMVDSSMSNLVTTDDGVTLASVPEAAADSARLVRQHSLYSSSPDGFLTGSDNTRNLSDFVNPGDGTTLVGFSRDFCDNGLKPRDYYNNWNRGHRYVLNLRDDESYTRYYRQLGTTANYWVPTERNGDPSQPIEIEAANRFGQRGNGSWSFVPKLTADAYAKALYGASNVVPAIGGGLQPATAGPIAEAIYKVQAADVIASQTIQAQFSRTDPATTATISVSINHGQTWTAAGTVGTAVGSAVPVTASLLTEVAGAYETLVRIQMSAPGVSSGIILTGLRIDTITQVNAKALPRLNVGKNKIFVGAGDQSDSMVLWPDLRFPQRDAYAMNNIATQGAPLHSDYTAVVYPSVLSQDAYLLYRMDAPTDLTRVVYGGRLHNYMAGSYVAFLHSFDNGATWVESYRLSSTSKPYDVIHYETVTDIPAGTRSVLFKYLIHNTYSGTFRAAGLYSARMEANHAAPDGGSRPIDVIYRWKEVRADRTLVERSHKQQVSTFPSTYTIDVGGSDHPVMESLSVHVEGVDDGTPYGYSDGIDVGGEKYLYRERHDGTNVAMHRPYTFSRSPSGSWNSAGAANTTILTDGVISAPATGGFSYWWGQCWSSGQDVDLQIDLGQLQTVSVFRAHLYGYDAWDALKGQVKDRVEVLTSADGVTFASQGLMPLSLWKKDIPINHMLQDDEKATAWNFEYALPAPVSTRHVRYHITPKRILCVSELQVLDHVDYTPFDIRIALPGEAPSQTDTPPAVTLTAPASGTTAGGAVGLAATATDDVGVTRVEFLVDGMVVATALNAPYAASWDSTTVADGAHTVTARAIDTIGQAALSPGVAVTVANAGPIGPSEIVLYASRASTIAGAWRVEADATAAGGALIRHPDAGAAKLLAPLAAPVNYFELTFPAVAGGPYHLWLRGRADKNTYLNDSVFVQFSNVTTAALGTTSAATVTLEDCTSCGVAGWGWQDDGAGVLGPNITFTTSGQQTIRIQTREDGLAIDQIVLSPSRFLATSPGALKNDTTFYAATADTTPPTATLSAPSTGATLGGWVALTATASDNVGVARVEFLVDGTVVASVTTPPPYTVNWDSTTVVDGAHSVSARAVDGAQNATVSPAASITITNAPPVDVIPPTVSLTAPGTGTTVSGIVALAASGSDNVGVARVEFVVDGTVVATNTTPPYTGSWNSGSVADGPHTLRARAYDAAANVTESAALPVTVSNAPIGPSEIVLYASRASTIAGAWRVEADATAAGGALIRHPDAGAAKLLAPLAAPVNYFELTFPAVAGVPYHLWLRGRADKNTYLNDSVFVQFSNVLTNALGTTSAATVTLEDCTSCGVAGWGWQDNGAGVLGPNITFTTSGQQTIRIQTREDGLAIDQIVLSPSRFLAASPGALKNDTTVYPPQ